MQKRIKISVSQPEVNSDSQIPYVSYLVSGEDNKGSFSVRRRYREFNLLREKIVERWPGLYVPPIASKKLSGNTEDKFVQMRRKFLNYFVEKIAEREYFYFSDIFQLFIKGSIDFQKGVKELDRIDYEQMSTVYQKHFTELTQNTSSGELQMNTENDYEFMKTAEKKLQKVREQLRALSSAKSQYERQFNQCMSTSLPQYQQTFLLKYVQNDRSKLFLNSDNKFESQLKQYEQYASDNVLEDYCEIISYELREMRAFVQAIDSRKRAEETKESFENKRRDAKDQLEKLRNGKTTFKSIFTPGKKEDQIKELEKLIEKLEKDEEALGSMIFLMNAAISSQIAAYKKRRSQEYRSDMQKVNKKQIKEMYVLGKLLSIPLRLQ